MCMCVAVDTQNFPFFNKIFLRNFFSAVLGWVRGGAVSLQMNDGLDSISLVFITFWLKCSSPVDRVWGLQSSRYVPCLLGSMRCHEHILNSLS